MTQNGNGYFGRYTAGQFIEAMQRREILGCELERLADGLGIGLQELHGGFVAFPGTLKEYASWLKRHGELPS